MNNYRRILLVDDDEEDRFFFTEALKAVDGATLHSVAKNGKEALAQLEKTLNLPDFIFMDINMPLMNGIECLALIKQQQRTRGIPVIILSTDTYQKEALLKAGAAAVIKKPIESKTLKKQLDYALMQPQDNPQPLTKLQTLDG